MAGSNLIADPCTMSIKLSSSGKSIEFERLRFFLIRHHSKVFVVSSAGMDGASANKSNIYSVEASGLKLVCSKLQGRK